MRSSRSFSLTIRVRSWIPFLVEIRPVVRSVPLAVSYLTDGQNVPDDIQVARSGAMASMLLGMDR